MKVMALVCGEMGKVAIKDLFEYGDFDEVVVETSATITIHFQSLRAGLSCVR